MFYHDYPFDPSYGHDLTALLRIAAPEEPADFARLAEEIMGGAGRSERDGERFPDFRDAPSIPPGSRH